MNSSVDFICLSYKNSDFLIEKKIINSSFYFGSKHTDSYSIRTFVTAQDQLVISLDYVIRKVFGDEGLSEKAMVMDIDGQFYETSAEAFVNKINLSDFKLFGASMNPFYNSKGVIAVRFVLNNRIQYLLDLKDFLNSFNRGYL